MRYMHTTIFTAHSYRRMSVCLCVCEGGGGYALRDNMFLSCAIYSIEKHSHAEWRRPVGCLKLQVNFCKRATNYLALLREISYKGKASSGSTPPYTISHRRTPLDSELPPPCGWCAAALALSCRAPQGHNPTQENLIHFHFFRAAEATIYCILHVSLNSTMTRVVLLMSYLLALISCSMHPRVSLLLASSTPQIWVPFEGSQPLVSLAKP